MLRLAITCRADQDDPPKFELLSKEIKTDSVRAFDKDHIKFEFLSKSPEEVAQLFEPTKGKRVSLIIDQKLITKKLQVTPLSDDKKLIGLVLYFDVDNSQMQKAVNALQGKAGE
jgi:hypothetical protein